MTIWLKDLSTFFKEKRLTLKILVLLIILLSLFVNALMLVSTRFTTSEAKSNNEYILINYQKKLSSN